MMIFVDFKDKNRRYYDIRDKEIDKILKKNRPNLAIPMPAVGEVYFKMRDKCQDRINDVISEMNRLFDKRVVSPAYIHDAEGTFNLAKKLSKKMNDDRDYISPMDALITATAITDKDCKYLYTTDSMLISDTTLSRIIDNWREENEYEALSIRDISDIVKAR